MFTPAGEEEKKKKPPTLPPKGMLATQTMERRTDGTTAPIKYREFTEQPQSPYDLSAFKPVDQKQEQSKYDLSGFTPATPTTPAKTRPSDVGWQGLAGVSDIATGIPMLLGAAGSAIGTTFSRDDDPESHWGQEFMKNLMENSFFKAGMGGRMWVNEALGIEEPLSLEDQAARLATSTFIPGIGWLGAIAGGTTKLAMAGRLLTPLVRMQKGKPIQNISRIGIQAGIGGGIDQAVRGAIDHYAPDSAGATVMPPMWSKRAIEGVDTPQYIKALQTVKAAHQSSGEEDGIDLTMFDSPTTELNDEFNKLNPELADVDRKLENNEEVVTTKNAMIMSTLAILSAVGAKKITSLRNMPSKLTEGMDVTERPSALASAWGTIKDQPITGTVDVARRATQSFNEKWVDGTAHLRRALKEAGMGDEAIARLDGQAVVDTFGSVIEALRTGEFAGVQGFKTGSVAELAQKIRAMPKERQQIWNDGVAALHEWGRRDLATVRHGMVDVTKGQKATGTRIDPRTGEEIGTRRRAPGLWGKDTQGNKVLKEDDEIKAAIQALRNDEELFRHSRELAKINDDILEVAVKRGVLTDDIANGWRAKHIFVDPTDPSKAASLMYIPTKNITGRGGTWGKLAELMGFHTSKGDELWSGPANWKALDLEVEGSTLKPIDPLNATADHMFQVVDHVNRSRVQWNMLSQLAKVKVNARTGAVESFHGTGDVKFIGRIDPRESPDASNVRWHLAGEGHADDVLSPAERNMRRQLGADTPDFNPMNLVDKTNRIIVQKKGQFYMFEVANPHLKRALDMDPRITSGYLKFMNQWKNNFTTFTTGRGSTFGPTSFLYNQQLAAISAMSNVGFREGAITWLDSFRGAFEMFSYKVSQDVVQMLKRNLDQNTGLFANLAPDVAKALTRRLERKISNSILGAVQRESGALSSGIGSTQISGNITDVLEQAAPHLYNTYGANALPMLWRFWTHMNSSLHEGTALGVVMRDITRKGGLKALPDKQVGNIIRSSVRKAKDRVGDVRRRGTSVASDAFHTHVPFSGAMLQAWSVLGQAMRDHPYRFMGAVALTVGMPAAMEVTWNNAIEPDAKFTRTTVDGEVQEWTYRDYYWNGFTTQQRNDNMIMFVPGKPPWEAILMPIAPEFSLFRGVVIEGMDVLFNLSVGDARKTGNNGDHILAGLTRIFDIPVPPVYGALVAGATKMDFRAGFHTSIDEEGKTVMRLLHATPGGISRIGGDAGIKESGDELSIRTVQILYDLFGAGGATAVAMAEAYYGGKDDEVQPQTDRWGRAFSEAGIMFNKQARWVNPLFGKSLSPNPNGDQAKSLISKRKALELALSRLTTISSEGRAQAPTEVAGGNTLMGIEDPIYREVAASAGPLLAEIGKLDDSIARLKRKISSSENASVLNREDGTQVPVNATQKRRFIDAWKLQISSLRAVQLHQLVDYEKRASEYLTTMLGREDNPVILNLSNLSPRSNLPKQPTGSPN